MSKINQLESLNVFRAVVECGSFSAAARRLNVSPAWVSKSIERLEIQLGTTLFNRSTRHMQITENGQRCYSQGLEVLNHWQTLMEELSESHKSPRGKLRISVPMSWGLSEFSGVMNTFMERYPDIMLDIQLGDQHVNVMEEQFDLVLRLTNQLTDSSLLCKKITSYQLIACAAPAYLDNYAEPSHPSELNTHSTLVYLLAGAQRKWQFEIGKKFTDIYLQPRMESNNSKLLQSALLAGQGIALIPDFMVAEDIAAGRLMPLLKNYKTKVLNLYSLRPKNQKTPYRLKLLHDFLCKNLS